MENNIYNGYYQNYTQNPEFKRKEESQESFTALDKEKLKQDTAQFSQKAQAETEDTFVGRTVKNLKTKNFKKILISLAATIGTVVGLAFVGNKLSTKSSIAGNKVDNFLNKGDNFISKIYRKITGGIGKAKNSIHTKALNSKSKTIQDIAKTYGDKSRHAKPIQAYAKSYGSGGCGIFGLTPPDTLKTALKANSGLDDNVQEISKIYKAKGGIFARLKSKKNAKSIVERYLVDQATAEKMIREEFGEQANDIISKLNTSKGKINSSLGELFDNPNDIFNALFGAGSGSQIDVSDKLYTSLKDKLGKNMSQEEFTKFLADECKEGGKLANFANVDMKNGGVLSSWWPVRFFEKIGRKITGKSDMKFCRGNFGDSMIKFASMRGLSSSTLPGKIVQKSIIFPTEYITNFVNDKSGLGVFLCAQIMGLYNNVQEAPKGKKVATIADDFVGTIANTAITLPLAAGVTYGLATLKNLEGNGIGSKILKGIGKVAGAGLNTVKDGKSIPCKNKLVRFAGGALRLALIVYVLNPRISKPVKKAINKIFGKPYDKAEEQQKQMIEAQQKEFEARKNEIIPEMGITYGELAALMQDEKNRPIIENIQKDEDLIQLLQINPKILLDMINGADPNQIKAKAMAVFQNIQSDQQLQNIISENPKILTALLDGADPNQIKAQFGQIQQYQQSMQTHQGYYPQQENQNQQQYQQSMQTHQGYYPQQVAQQGYPQPQMQPQFVQPQMQPQFVQPQMQPQFVQPQMQPQFTQPQMQPQQGYQPQYGYYPQAVQYSQPKQNKNPFDTAKYIPSSQSTIKPDNENVTPASISSIQTKSIKEIDRNADIALQNAQKLSGINLNTTASQAYSHLDNKSNATIKKLRKKTGLKDI